ncbi:hypothetical protein DFJ77DRAFT_59069 [Powellomyces hirtus]|nr:hypothetical protein DFJ77DRAFT_59069 [Powellomyces hirtus]
MATVRDQLQQQSRDWANVDITGRTVGPFRFTSKLPPRVGAYVERADIPPRRTDYDCDTVPRAIANDPVTELLLQRDDEDVMTGRGKRRRRPWQCDQTTRELRTNIIMSPPKEEPENVSETQADGRTIILTDWGIDIINLSYVVPIPRLVKPVIACPTDRPVYSVNKHKALPLRFPRTARYGTWRNAVGVFPPVVVQAAAATGKEWGRRETDLINDWVLRYMKPVVERKRAEIRPKPVVASLPAVTEEQEAPVSNAGHSPTRSDSISETTGSPSTHTPLAISSMADMGQSPAAGPPAKTATTASRADMSQSSAANSPRKAVGTPSRTEVSQSPATPFKTSNTLPPVEVEAYLQSVDELNITATEPAGEPVEEESAAIDEEEEEEDDPAWLEREKSSLYAAWGRQESGLAVTTTAPAINTEQQSRIAAMDVALAEASSPAGVKRRSDADRPGGLPSARDEMVQPGRKASIRATPEKSAPPATPLPPTPVPTMAPSISVEDCSGPQPTPVVAAPTQPAESATVSPAESLHSLPAVSQRSPTGSVISLTPSFMSTSHHRSIGAAAKALFRKSRDSLADKGDSSADRKKHEREEKAREKEEKAREKEEARVREKEAARQAKAEKEAVKKREKEGKKKSHGPAAVSQQNEARNAGVRSPTKDFQQSDATEEASSKPLAENSLSGSAEAIAEQERLDRERDEERARRKRAAAEEQKQKQEEQEALERTAAQQKEREEAAAAASAAVLRAKEVQEAAERAAKEEAEAAIAYAKAQEEREALQKAALAEKQRQLHEEVLKEEARLLEQKRTKEAAVALAKDERLRKEGEENEARRKAGHARALEQAKDGAELAKLRQAKEEQERVRKAKQEENERAAAAAAFLEAEKKAAEVARLKAAEDSRILAEEAERQHRVKQEEVARAVALAEAEKKAVEAKLAAEDAERRDRGRDEERERRQRAKEDEETKAAAAAEIEAENKAAEAARLEAQAAANEAERKDRERDEERERRRRAKKEADDKSAFEAGREESEKNAAAEAARMKAQSDAKAAAEEAERKDRERDEERERRRAEAKKAEETEKQKAAALAAAAAAALDKTKDNTGASGTGIPEIVEDTPDQRDRIGSTGSPILPSAASTAAGNRPLPTGASRFLNAMDMRTLHGPSIPAPAAAAPAPSQGQLAQPEPAPEQLEVSETPKNSIASLAADSDKRKSTNHLSSLFGRKSIAVRFGNMERSESGPSSYGDRASVH